MPIITSRAIAQQAADARQALGLAEVAKSHHAEFASLATGRARFYGVEEALTDILDRTDLFLAFIAELQKGGDPTAVTIFNLTPAFQALNNKLDSLAAKIDSLAAEQTRTKQLTESIMATAADVRAKVEAQGTVISSAKTLLEQLSQMLKDAGTDPQALQDIIDMLDTQDQELSDAVVANTPAANPPPPGP